MPRINVRCSSGFLALPNLSVPTTILCEASPRRFQWAVTLNGSTKLETFRSNKHDKKTHRTKIIPMYTVYIYISIQSIYMHTCSSNYNNCIAQKLRFKTLSAKSESFLKKYLTKISNHVLQPIVLGGFSMLIPEIPRCFAAGEGDWMG